jgi:predicted DNA-binding protein
MDELIRIPVSTETHEKLKELARADGKSLADFLRDIVQRELGEKVNMRRGLKSWGGRRDRQAE